MAQMPSMRAEVEEMNPKQVTKMMIKRASKVAYTAPENIIQEIVMELGQELGFIAEQNVPLRLKDSDGTMWSYQIDHFLHSPKFKKQICLHTDGVYHDTKRIEQKDKWKDEVILKNGMRSFHVDAGLATKEWKEYVKTNLKISILGEKDVVYFCA